MNFNDYQKASLKHLNTCKVLVDSMDLLKNDDVALINDTYRKKAILHNLVYLSGYTLECIINYSIFKHYKWKETESVYNLDHKFSRRSNVTFAEGTRREPYEGMHYTYWLSAHAFQRNIQVLKKEFSASKVPLIDSSVAVDADLLKLFNAWKVEIRYYNTDALYSSLKLSEDIVKRFVLLTEIVYNSLMKLVG